MSILIRGAELKRKKRDIYIEGNRIMEVAERIRVEADHVIKKKYLAAVPALYNTHSHAAMTMLRGYADDMELMDWLTKKIWPLEASMTPEDIYSGTKLACLEMIKSGTVFFNDMYWSPEMAVKAASEMGLRAAVGLTLLDAAGDAGSVRTVRKNYSILKAEAKERISLTIAPHSIYTVSEENLLWAKEFAEKKRLMLHFHLSETKTEVTDCVKKTGMRPVEYLDSIGFLGRNLITAHNVHLSSKEIKILAKRKVNVNYNPVSNMKLAVGSALDYKKMVENGIRVSLGTDGCSSNNNLDMSEEMKVASLIQKHHYNDPELLPAREAFDMGSLNGATQFGLCGGRVKEGWLADLLLIDLKNPCMMPGYNIISDIVYSANGNCVDTTICDGKILMENRVVPNERSIQSTAYHSAMALYARAKQDAP